MSLRVLVPGPLTTVQDLGREGWRHLGIGCAGALDPDSARIANRLVGNLPEAATLEFTLQGPTLELDIASRIAVCGAALNPRFTGYDGERVVLDAGRPIDLPPGRLELGRLRRAARAWIAFAGGIEVPLLMGSRSTDLRAGFGGFEGRALAVGDRLALGLSQRPEIPGVRAARWQVRVDPPEQDGIELRYVPSGEPAAGALGDDEWQIDPRSNRQGLRLRGPALPGLAGDRISAAVAPGTIQLPPDGQPIILLADAQTVGGYPRLGYVAAVDRHRLAQLLPGTKLRLRVIDEAQARELRRQREADLRRLELLIAQRRSSN